MKTFQIGDRVELQGKVTAAVRPDLPRGVHRFTEEQPWATFDNWGSLEFKTPGIVGVVVAIHSWHIPGESPEYNVVAEWPNGTVSILGSESLVPL